MKRLFICGWTMLMLCQLPAVLQGGEFRLGAHGNFINPRDSDFDEEFGYGAVMKYKFTDTLGIEIGLDYFRWEIDELIEMPFGPAASPINYKEIDRVYPIYFTAMIFSPYLEQDARAYLGLGGGYYEVDADIEGNYNAIVNGVTYPFTIDGKVEGQWSVHLAVGADFQLSEHIYLNAEARYVFVDLDREQTHSTNVTTPTGVQVVKVKDEVEFDNWQIRLGLEYSF